MIEFKWEVLLFRHHPVPLKKIFKKKRRKREKRILDPFDFNGMFLDQITKLVNRNIPMYFKEIS